MSDHNPGAAAGIFFAFASAAAFLLTSGAVYRAGFRAGIARGFRAGVERTALTFRRIIDAAHAREFFPRGTVRNATREILTGKK